ncbi:DNA-binding response regulator [Chromobacterium phragmitis]|uniref:DNA-binding response regulator n=1 Tax=Chromobacterium phragmitis TaxID=2202141 RepID=A0A344UIU7_9NEIS|nr:response regulator transcription factor [Chromobacterium phragmitis]AXE29802.1 DNA-binding response regulator [Chromobacterium phragmitis]AXE35195.1 DNA-binding response regulator [Chromobacterium phragmitis]
MGHLLFTASSVLAGYWEDALGEARRCERLPVPPRDRDAALWLDLASLGAAQQGADWPNLCRCYRVVALSSAPNDAEGMHWLQLGVSGYAHAYAGADELRQIAASVAAGGTWLGRSLLLQLCQRFGALVPPTERADWRERVSSREAEVIAILKQGRSNKEIARELDIAERTVKAHLTAIFHKFGVEDRFQLLLKLTQSAH